MLKLSSLAKWGVAVLLMSSLSSCEDIFEQYFPKPTPPPSNFGADIPFYALSDGLKLDAYSTHSPTNRSSSVSITGLQAGERILAIDFRPATGELYGVGSTSRIYIINPKTGTTRTIGQGPFSPAIAGSLVGFDFNPTVDRIRLVTSTGQNLRLNPETGAGTIVDGNITGVPNANISAAAYTNNVAGASTTELFALDVTTKSLYKVNPPNDGTLVAVADIKLNISGNGGFDIDPRNDSGLGLFEVNGRPTLFSVDVQSGATRTLATYDSSLRYTGLAIPTKPVAYAITTAIIDFEQRTSSANLLIFDPTDIGAGIVTKRITGLPAVENLAALDFRPANGQLYALARTFSYSRVYTINAATGAATPLSSTIPTITGLAGFDFNPVLDRIRAVFDGDVNSDRAGNNTTLLINPNNGVATRDTNLELPLTNGDPLGVTGIAYSNNFAGATSTTLYAIDRQRNRLMRPSSSNSTELVEIGRLGLNITRSEFDISSTTNTAYALLPLFFPSNTSMLYKIDLSTGKASPVNDYNFGGSVFGFTIGLGF